MWFISTLFIAALAIPMQALADSKSETSELKGQERQNKTSEVAFTPWDLGEYTDDGKRLKYNATFMVHPDVTFKPGDGQWNMTNATYEDDKQGGKKGETWLQYFIAYSDTREFKHTFSLDLNDGEKTSKKPQCHFGNELEGKPEDWKWKNFWRIRNGTDSGAYLSPCGRLNGLSVVCEGRSSNCTSADLSDKFKFEANRD